MHITMASLNHSNPEAYLIPYPAETFSKPIPIRMGKTTIGREQSNVIQITHESVGHHHAVISFDNGKYVLIEREGQNATCINGERITVAALHHHDKISFGKSSFIFLLKSEVPGGEDTKPLIGANKTFNILEEELEPSELLAQSATDAALEMFKTPSGDPRMASGIGSLAHQRLSLLYQLSEKIRSAKTQDEILNQGLALLLDALHTAQRAMVLLRSQNSETLEVCAAKFRDPEANTSAFPVSRTVIDWVLTEKIALVSQNLSEDQRFKHSDSIRLHNLNSIIVVPMMKDERVIGMIYIDGRDLLHAFTRQDLAFAAAVANELALCTENIRLQNELIQIERMAAIGLTMSNLAHNIKNLLSLNQNAVDLLGLQLKRLEDSRIDKSWRYILQSFTRINNLAANMLGFAREQEMVLQRISVNRIVLAARDAIEQSLASKGIDLQLNLSDADPKWMIDANQFQRALLNLVVNAVDAVKEKADGIIVLSTALDNESLIVSVSDNGCGISQDKLPRIFDLFYTTKGTGGSGLGLPMVKKFVEKMGGTIAIVSEINVGTTVRMTFTKAALAASQEDKTNT
jgi:signal transduction histidine kinase